MHPKSLKTRLVAIFLVAFVCLNAGGTICVAYCQSAMELIASSEDHCPLKKKADHCDPQPQEKRDSAAKAAGNTMDWCSMTLSFVGAPLEKRAFSSETVVLSAAVKTNVPSPAAFLSSGRSSPPAYRGPPLDRRVDRVKHCLIRI